MKSEQIQYFLEAAELGSMLKVAERHYLSQPAVSMAISNLEKELGVQLLMRSRQGISLTEAGQVARTHFEAMAAQLLALEEAPFLIKLRPSMRKKCCSSCARRSNATIPSLRSCCVFMPVSIQIVCFH